MISGLQWLLFDSKGNPSPWYYVSITYEHSLTPSDA